MLFTNAQLKKLIIPLMIEQTLAILVGMADTIMVSSLGEASVSGVALVDMISVVIINVFSALATGGAVVSSQFLGARRKDEACRSSNQLVLAALAVSMGIAVSLLLFRRPVLKLLFGSIEPDVMSAALTYLEITALSYPFIALYNAAAALFRSMNRSRVTMYTSLLMNAINCAGNAICIYGFGMGVEGAAIPTLISRFVAAAILLYLIGRPNQDVHLMPHNYRPDFAMMRRILRIGIPNGIESGLFQMGRVLVLGIISTFGTVQIAANSVACVIDNLGILPGQAMSLAMVTVIGHCVGAKDERQVRYYTRKLMVWSYIFTAIVNIPIQIWLRPITEFYQLSPETLDLACILIRIHGIFTIFMWPAAFVLPYALRACNDVRFTMYVSVASMGCFRVLFSYIFGMGLGWGAVGVWWAMILDWCCRIAFFVWRYFKGTWRKTALLE